MRKEIEQKVCLFSKDLHCMVRTLRSSQDEGVLQPIEEGVGVQKAIKSLFLNKTNYLG